MSISRRFFYSIWDSQSFPFTEAVGQVDWLRTRTSESGLNNRIVKSDILALNSSETGDGEKEDVRSLCLRNLKSPSQKTFVCAHSERISNRARSSVIQGVDGDDETDSWAFKMYPYIWMKTLVGRKGQVKNLEEFLWKSEKLICWFNWSFNSDSRITLLCRYFDLAGLIIEVSQDFF